MTKISYILALCISPLLLLSIHSFQKFDASQVKEGDIIFHQSHSRQSRAIKLATNSKYTHVGIIFKFNNKLQVLEAVQPVRLTDLNRFIKRGVKRHFIIKRLKNYDDIMTGDILKKLKDIGKSFLGRDYDLYFEWSDRRIYCSELIWKIYYRVTGIELGKLEKLKDFNLNAPLVKKLMRKRYGRSIPYNEIVISPVSIFNSDHLVTVFDIH